MKVDLKPEFDREKNSVRVAGADMVIHCHHYNTHLLRNLEESGFVDASKVVSRSVEKSIYKAVGKYAAAHPDAATPADKLQVAAEMAKTFGFGILDFAGLGEKGGTAFARSSHFARGWVVKWGNRETPGCYFLAGYIAGALAVAYEKPVEYYRVTEDECLATGADMCKFTVERK